MSAIQRLVLIRVRRIRDVRRLAILGAVMTVAGCASTGATLRSNHFHLQVPPGWQVLEAGSGESPAVVRAPSDGTAPAVDVHVYAWLVDAPPTDPSRDALQRLTGLASARADDDDPCPARASQYFVFGTPARALHLVDTGGGHIVVTAGEFNGSLVALVGTVAPGVSGCEASKRLDAVIERLVASLSPSDDPTLVRQPRSVGPDSAIAPPLRVPVP